MSFLAIIMLATSIHSTAAIATPVNFTSHTAQARIVLNRQIATREAAMRREAVQKALSTARRTFGRSLRNQIATTRVRPTRATPQLAMARNAKTRLDREVARNEQTLHRHAIATALAGVTRSARDTFGSLRKTARVQKAPVARLLVTRRAHGE